MKFGSLFSGIGGFDLGFERSGMECAWQCEIDEKARAVLAKHWPDVRRYTDVREIGKHNLETVDVICGGFPCQDLSIAGKRAGLVGERSGLWFEFARIIEELKPGWVVIENVPGLLSSNGGRDFEVVLSGLVERGYGVAWRVLDAQYFGLAQRRRRVFIVGSLGNGRAAEVLFEREGMCWNPPARGSQRENIAQTVTSRIGKGGFTDPVNDNIIAQNSVAVIQLGHTKSNGLGIYEQNVANTLEAVNSEHGHQPIIAGTLDQKSCGANRGCQANETDFVVWDFHRQDGSFRPQKHTSPTVAAKWGTGGNNMPFVGVRRLTPTECERLQGFPDGWTGDQSDSARYKQLGNAVAVPVAEWIGKRIIESDLEIGVEKQ